MNPKYPVRAVNETGNLTIDVQLFQVPDSAISEGSGTVSLATATGDVTGPSSATDNAIARFNSTTGKIIQNSAGFVDDNGNVYGSNIAPGLLSTLTSATPITLTVASKGVQVLTGSTAQTIALPVVTTLPQIGFAFLVVNDSTQSATVNSSGGNLVQTIVAGGRALISCALLTGTSAASWTSTYIPPLGGLLATATELNQLNDVSGYEETVVAAGAMSVTKVVTKLAVASGGAVTLAVPDASMYGQLKTIEMTTDDGDVTFLLTNVVGQSSGTTATFDSVGDALVLLAAFDKWIVIKEYGITLS